MNQCIRHFALRKSRLSEPQGARLYQWFQRFSFRTRVAKPCSWRWVPRCGCKTDLGRLATILPPLQAGAFQGCPFTTCPKWEQGSQTNFHKKDASLSETTAPHSTNDLSSFSFFFKDRMHLTPKKHS